MDIEAQRIMAVNEAINLWYQTQVACAQWNPNIPVDEKLAIYQAAVQMYLHTFIQSRDAYACAPQPRD